MPHVLVLFGCDDVDDVVGSIGKSSGQGSAAHAKIGDDVFRHRFSQEA
jgi:hypothetical protein